ncbi:MAG TPA: hypothetical protein VGQ95_05195 [Chthoniobacterales bacterium]|nr:hypothetical protein [Chthoniobacterales bacterium]
MRKILFTLAIVIVLAVTMSALWIFGGRGLSLFLDRFWTIETASEPIRSIKYQGNGTGGTLRINERELSLRTPDTQIQTLHIGSTKDNQLAVAIAGKVFAFGPLRQSEGDTLATEPATGDDASITTRHSPLSWPTPFDFNFMTGQSPSWRQHLYYELSWKRQSGAKLDMLWRFEQYFYSGNGWLGGSMTYESGTGLIRVEISEAAR